MIYLSGKLVMQYEHPRLGSIITARRRQPIPPHGPVAADNGCFADPGSYTDAGYLKFLTRFPRSRTLFATAPDVLKDHHATVALALPILEKIRAIGLPAAFVAQDGWEEASTPWGKFDVLFIGGSTGFKFRGGRDATAAAKRRGIPVHMGRVNSFDRLRAAAALGCKSADGNYITFGPDKNLPKVLRWLDSLHHEPGFHYE